MNKENLLKLAGLCKINNLVPEFINSQRPISRTMGVNYRPQIYADMTVEEMCKEMRMKLIHINVLPDQDEFDVLVDFFK